MKMHANHFSLEMSPVKLSYAAPAGKVDVSLLDYELLFRTLINDEAFIQQQVYAVFVGANDEMLTWRMISSGDTCCVLLNTRLLLTLAIQLQAASIIICHTRPHFTPAVEHGSIDEFLKQFLQLVSVLNIHLRAYMILGQRDCMDAFGHLGYTAKAAQPCILH